MNLQTLPRIAQTARWIWPQSMHWDLHNGYALFRKTFTLSSPPAKAPLYITADQSYQLYINGSYVCRGPARGFQKSWSVDKIDIAKWLKKGENIIAVRAYNPGYSNFQYISQSYAGLLVFAQIDGINIVTDETWNSRRQSGIRKASAPVSLQLFSQEIIDLNLEDSDWMQLNYDDSEWHEKLQSSVWNAMPWHTLESRDIAMLDERTIDTFTLIGQASGVSKVNYTNTYNLAVHRYREGLGHMKVQSVAKPYLVPKTGKGHWSSLLLDLGKLHVGSLILDIENARGGEIIEAHYYETIDEESLTPDFAPEAHCRMAFSSRLTCKPGNFSYSFYHTFGFRYLVLTIRDNTDELTICPKLRSAVYPMVQNGKFTSSDHTLNAIWITCAWTQRVCSLDAYVDTPWREQAQWWGDARVQAWNTFYLNGDTRLFRRGIQQIATQTTPEGVTYGHAPTIAHNCILPDFTLIWIITLWDYYWQTGSVEPFLKHQRQIRHALEYFADWTDLELGLLKYDKRFWLFLDWTNLRKQGCSSVYSLWYLYTLDRLSALYEAVGQADLRLECKQRAKVLRQSLLRLISKDGLMRDGYTSDGKIDHETSVHAQTLAIMTQLQPEKNEIMLQQRLLAYLLDKHSTQLKPSAYWITYLYSVLAEYGYGLEVVEDIRKRWTPMVAHGTTWENFNPLRGHESHSHAWSAHPLFHLMQIIGGVRQQAPNWKQILCAPTFYGDSAEVTIPTPHGKIHSVWKRKAFSIKGRLELPKGITAIIDLPQHDTVTTFEDFHYEIAL
ncbi:alpha-L-rhamnosidase C-terminal domain-containing protein [Cerasicoccus maritimus]|uniref:alpha-L-rhamnosidase-related protein n=1 Tax=Cerasicoccus maritimus TaxID=490089 RepID=UPI0028525AEC|nr:alpha-L-rhamnosidase C-terminal domain-containing protein [Cerasicoccus maritimus]